MHDEADYGSVSVGKVADILIVAGKPATRIEDLAGIETVIRGGRLYKVSDLRAASAGRPPAPSGAEGADHPD